MKSDCSLLMGEIKIDRRNLSIKFKRNRIIFIVSLFSNNIDWTDQKVKIIHRSHHHFSKTLQIQFNDIDYPTKKEKK